MPRPRTQKIYFGEDQEKAVVSYLESTDDAEKNKIFNEFLREPLIIMVESIIRRYKLYRKDLEFQEIHNDTLSFLITKINKFDHTKNHKAYSYFGTICKNYLMGQIMKDQKEMNRKISYEDISSDLCNRPEMSYLIDNDDLKSEHVIKKFLQILKDDLDKITSDEQEKKIGSAIYDLFENYDTFFPETNNNKFNKNIILFELREMTNLSTKEIRNSIKKYKKMYFELVQELLKH